MHSRTWTLLIISGGSIGYLLTMPITGLLTKYGFDGGWASVFYCFGEYLSSIQYCEILSFGSNASKTYNVRVLYVTDFLFQLSYR